MPHLSPSLAASLASLLASSMPLFPPRRRVVGWGVAVSAALALATAAWPLRAATPKDSLVLATAFDDIITLDPAEAFEISTGELTGNSY